MTGVKHDAECLVMDVLIKSAAGWSGNSPLSCHKCDSCVYIAWMTLVLLRIMTQSYLATNKVT